MVIALCKCGCGLPAPIAKRSSTEKGWVRGMPLSFIHGHNPKKPVTQVIIEFWEKVNFPVGSDCIEWDGAINSNGYGYSIPVFGTRQAHRVAYLLTFGAVPPGLDLDHLCRNRKCVNPYHLEPVTRAVNSRRGIKCVVTPEIAEYIRQSPKTERPLARELGISRGTVNSVRSGRTWRNDVN